MLKIKKLFLGTVISILIFSSCKSDIKDETDKNAHPIENVKTDIVDYRSKFAGGYTIEVKGVSSAQEVELYALNENGGAKWMWIENDGNDGAIVQDEKSGTWKATENSITINIKGNSGTISETYELINNVLTNTQQKKRYLKKTE